MSDNTNDQTTAVPKQQIVHTPTPGPWDRTVYGHGGSRIFVGVRGGDERERTLIADTYQPGDANLIFASHDLKEFAESFIREWEETWVDPDEVNHEWQSLYQRAKELIRGINGGHSV